ncbi:MAG: Alpha/beta hydrolase [Nocardioides sp.]|nr:Alpha/beta hydrolase [Nocardioides sp.]
MPDSVSTPDGRRLEILTGGAADGLPFLFHSGTPSAATSHQPLWAAAARAGLRLVTYSRPGYGGSTPRPVGPPVPIAADAVDSATVLDALGIDRFVTLGWSGGGPRALACAALLPGRCLAAASLAGVAPADAADLDFTGGMGPENVRDFELASRGREALRPVVEEQAADFGAVTGAQIVEAFGGLVDEVDAAALTGELGEYVAASFRGAMTQGAVGLLEDNLQVMQPWGFDVADITVPVAVWQGAHDKMVPFAHGQWLAARIRGARVHLFDDEGHLSLLHRMDEMLAELVELAGPGSLADRDASP